MTKPLASESSPLSMSMPTPTHPRRLGKKRGAVAAGTAIALLVVVGTAIGLMASSSLTGDAGWTLFANAQCTAPCVPGSEDIMIPKAHGTSEYPVQQDLRYGVDWDLADRINNFNRHYAEYAGYWESTSFQSDVDQDMEDGKAVTFYDSGWKGHPLFTAPMDRTWDDFLSESKKHGWPSFRDTEVNWDYARVLPGGEMVSVDGSHLGHNLPDRQGNRYCINLVSIAGNPVSDSDE